MSKINEKYSILFTPFKVGNVEIKNRFAMAGMGGNDEVDARGMCAANAIEYYVERARGGVGLVCTGTMTVTDRLKYKSIEVLLPETIETDTFVRGFQQMNERIHAYGAKSMIQLSLGTSPSKIKGVFSPSLIANDFTKDDFKYFVARYKAMTAAAKRAGFDIVEVHSLHTGYLLDQLASAEVNHRTDEYGGSLENRLRLMAEIREAIRESCGPDYPVSVKMGGSTVFYDYDENEPDPEKRIKNYYRRLPETIEITKHLEKLGYNMFVFDGVGPNAPYEDIRKWEKDFKAIQDAVNVPVVGAARLNDPDISSDFIRDGALTAISLGRQTFADPDYFNKLRCNRIEDIRFCLSCNQGCISRNMNELTVKCAINPVAGREQVSDFAPLRRKKKVMIIGAGPGGLETARVAASRGHDVTVYDRDDRTGGMYYPATAFPYKKFGRHYIDLLTRQATEAGAKIVLGKEISRADVDREDPDVVVVAIGANELIPPIKGADSAKVVTTVEHIEGKGADAQNVVVIGAGVTGCEIALEDAQAGKNVTLVEMQDRILTVKYLDYLSREGLMACIKKADMNILTRTKLVEINDEGAVVEGPNGVKTIPADVIVMAVGYRPRTGLYEELRDYAGEVYNIGNSKAVGNVCDAVWAAYEVGNGI